MQRYHLDKNDIDLLYRNEYDAESDESRLRALFRPVSGYRVKRIISGSWVEFEIYPCFDKRRHIVRAKKYKETPPPQKENNYNNAIKKIIRLIHTNFTETDQWVTLTYTNDKMPPTREAANREMQKYLRRLRIDAERRGYPPLKYIYATEYGEKRIHHHFVTNYPDRDRAEKFWRGGGRTQARRLQADEHGFEGMARYLAKKSEYKYDDPQGKKRYVVSRNLDDPIIERDDSGVNMSRRKAHKILMGDIDPRAFFEKLTEKYPETRNADYKFLDMTPKTSDYVAGVYLYVRMRRRN